MAALRITFVVPGDNRSGGIRVTARMAGLLRERGHEVRIVHPAVPLFSRERLKACWARVQEAATGRRTRGWLHTFDGPIEAFRDIDDLHVADGDVVIAVGTYMVADVDRLRRPNARKVRYNHGLPAQMTADYRRAWSLPMHTITVSRTLVPRLESLSGQPVRAVVPNGLDLEQYSAEPGVVRDGIGTIFSLHPNKAPADIVEVFQRIARCLPDGPRVVFSTEPRPSGLDGCLYERFPDVERVRTLYSRCKVWVLASHTEGLPGSVLEAMACGCVVVSTDNDGSREVLRHGENGLLVPVGQIDAFVPAIRRVMADEALRERLALQARLTACSYTWQHAVDTMESFLGELTESGAAHDTGRRATSVRARASCT